MQQISCYGKEFGKWEPAPRYYSLIPGLPNEMAFMVLARVPRSLYGRLRYVCRAWRDALHVQASLLTSLRTTLGVSEEWVILLSDSGDIVFFDPLLQCFSKPLSLHKPRVGCFIQVFGTPDNLCLIHETVQCSDSFRCFDTSSMLWHRKSYYFPLIIRHYTSWVVVGNHLYIVGGEKSDSRKATSRVDMYDITTQTWGSLPNMHVGRARAAAVPVQGRLYVIGGQNYKTQTKIYSGEIWDAERQEWILEPQLWPCQLFDNTMPIAAVVMGTIYALQSVRKEFLCYDPATKLWTSLGVIPLAEYHCGDVQDAYCKQFLGVRDELWMVWYCSRLPNYRYRILAYRTTAKTPSLSWRVLPITMAFREVSVVHV